MREAYVPINSVPTHIMCWGKWIEESFDPGTKEIIICITGNPGLTGFYAKFLHNLYVDLKIPIWCIGHAGHDDPPDSSILQVPNLTGNESLFDLKGQIQHKMDFIESYVPANVKIHLIGHSIGAWIITELLKNQSIKNRIKKGYLLFPTLERMNESPNGKFFLNGVLPVYPVLHFMMQLLYIFPNFIRIGLVYIYFFLFSIPYELIGTAMKYSKPACIDKVVFLAEDEMKYVRVLNLNIIKENVKLLKFYYGAIDGWAPVTYYNEIKQKIPDIDAELDNKNLSHAFVLRQSDQMSEVVLEWIKQNLN